LDIYALANSAFTLAWTIYKELEVIMEKLLQDRIVMVMEAGPL
jgi:hypothetical protein